MVDMFWINGVESEGRIAVTDSSVLRGDGCFEVLRAYDGSAFAIDEHLDRLERSASKLEIPLPSRSDIATWVESAAQIEPNGAVRVVVTRGSAVPGEPSTPLVIVFAHRWDRGGETLSLGPVSAPWHSAGADWELSGAKVLSYAPNLAATRSARHSGFDEAMLVTSDDVILEGPTFAVAWVRGGVLETPTLDLGILDSITRRHVLDLAVMAGIETREGEYALDRLESADEVMALSTIREVQPVSSVGSLRFAQTEVTGRLSQAFAQLVASAD
jgi:branched-subunit amino acid aminotransferase/4-amino-4-deoxychorismate lyase